MASVGMDDLRSLRRKILSAASRSYSAICADGCVVGSGDLQPRPGFYCLIRLATYVHDSSCAGGRVCAWRRCLV